MTNAPTMIRASSPTPRDDAPRPTEQVRIGPFALTWADDLPASLIDVLAHSGSGRVPLLGAFTAAEQRSRTSQSYVRSAVGERFRVASVESHDADDAERLFLRQIDERTGLHARTVITHPRGTTAVRIETEYENRGEESLVLTAVVSAAVTVGRSQEALADLVVSTADSEWLAENRWQERPLRDLLPALSLPIHDQDGRGHFGLTSHGAWSSGEHLPCGVISDGSATIAWQIETSAGWHVDLAQTRGGAVLSLLGPADLEHHFAHELAPGGAFAAVPVALAVSTTGRDAAIAQLTSYRRWLRRDRGDAMPVVYNDFMNTLMGQPSTESLRPLIREAAAAGAEIFCIDAGWFADPEIGDWWSTVGEWREAPGRFAGGLDALIREIHDLGMRSGLWLEPEVVGVGSPTAASLPEEAFFHRFGQRVREHDRYHLDFRHPAARAHLDETIDHLVEAHGISYLKLDYNINPGAGTETDATSAADGLLGHTRAFRQWLVDLGRRHPDLLVENCSSGAMRADYALLAVTHLQSTSDQQDFRRYAPIAASAPASILPEQCGNWAYPARDMSEEETVFTIVSGLSGRFYLSGFLDRLRPEQRVDVAAAVALHKELRDDLGAAEPFWPLGLPGWEDELICLGLRTASHDLIFVWDRGEPSRVVTLPELGGEATQIFPAERRVWPANARPEGLELRTGEGIGARVFRVDHV
ncbi:glycoside hydrolase family 36 protein [Microbacterium sp. NPDC089189]|uniref:glycoside hydrolase family 36 protein n=1 Tax=Microbacterium sp. NPDC089189 TaxID=3154972 RepID=UPI003415A2C4